MYSTFVRFHSQPEQFHHLLLRDFSRFICGETCRVHFAHRSAMWDVVAMANMRFGITSFMIAWLVKQTETARFAFIFGPYTSYALRVARLLRRRRSLGTHIRQMNRRHYCIFRIRNAIQRKGALYYVKKQQQKESFSHLQVNHLIGHRLELKMPWIHYIMHWIWIRFPGLEAKSELNFHCRKLRH